MNIKMLLLFWESLFFIFTTTHEKTLSLPENFLNEISANNIVEVSEDSVRKIDYRRPIFTPSFYGLKNDTIFDAYIYTFSDSIKKIDSLAIKNIYVPTGKGNFWICDYDDGNVRISKFKKYRHPSEDFLNANGNSYWEAEMEMRSNKLYNKDMVLIEKVIRFGTMAFSYSY